MADKRATFKDTSVQLPQTALCPQSLHAARLSNASHISHVEMGGESPRDWPQRYSLAPSPRTQDARTSVASHYSHAAHLDPRFSAAGSLGMPHHWQNSPRASTGAQYADPRVSVASLHSPQTVQVARLSNASNYFPPTWDNRQQMGHAASSPMLAQSSASPHDSEPMRPAAVPFFIKLAIFCYAATIAILTLGFPLITFNYRYYLTYALTGVWWQCNLLQCKFSIGHSERACKALFGTVAALDAYLAPICEGTGEVFFNPLVFPVACNKDDARFAIMGKTCSYKGGLPVKTYMCATYVALCCICISLLSAVYALLHLCFEFVCPRRCAAPALSKGRRRACQVAVILLPFFLILGSVMYYFILIPAEAEGGFMKLTLLGSLLQKQHIMLTGSFASGQIFLVCGGLAHFVLAKAVIWVLRYRSRLERGEVDPEDGNSFLYPSATAEARRRQKAKEEEEQRCSYVTEMVQAADFQPRYSSASNYAGGNVWHER